ncbi:MAG: type II secretion system protein, partial [Planctomycetota bacterium]
MMRKRKQAFTLIELLVVVAIISALVGILSVAQKKVKYHARTLRQKAEFHGMDISLELFHSDFRDYPDSDVVDESGVEVSGAQRLAEAMLGRDEEGFHPKTKWHP